MKDLRRALSCLQQHLQTFYALEQAPDVNDFVQVGAPGGRETLVVRHTGDELELALVLPDVHEPAPPLDTQLQLIEGVSHFMYVVERARTELPTTELELELQAEVDKFVVLGLDEDGRPRQDAKSRVVELFHDVTFLHAEGTPSGERYRTANALAARLTSRLAEQRGSLTPFLRRFYRSGQTEKIHWARAA